MLKTTVGWTLMFRVRDKDKAKKELRRAEDVHEKRSRRRGRGV
jgi:hypothetical protein